MREIDKDTLHQVVTELMEDAAPDKEDRINQAITDLKKDLAAKQSRFRAITARLGKVEGLMVNLAENNGLPETKLVIKALQDRRDSLEIEAEGINLAKMVKKLGLLERDLQGIKDNQELIEIIEVSLHG